MRFWRVTFLFLLGAASCFALPFLNKNITQGDVRVPVILVEFEDVKFTSEDVKTFYLDILNEEGFNEDGNIGSVRDYYIYNSMGVYRPSFDVYGPVTLPNTKEFYDTPSSLPTADEVEFAFSQAVEILLSQGVDFSMYDNDGDGAIEASSMIYAGKRGGSSGGLWPAKREIELKINDNLLVSRFSCVDEMSETSTFIHEFGHILGLPDVYIPPSTPIVGSWSIMDSPEKRSPSLYSSFDRMLMGWFTPTELGDDDFIRLDKLDDNVAISITNPENENEMYMLEYRTNKGWDRGQANSGLLIWYVDYNDSAWARPVNNHGCYAREYVVRARPFMAMTLISGETCAYGVGPAWPADVFPGTDSVTSFDEFVFRNGLNMNITLSEITESEDKSYVTFKVSRSTPYMEEIESSSSSSDPSVRPNFSSSSFTYSPLDSVRFVKITLEPSVINPPVDLVSKTQATMQGGSLHIWSSGSGEKAIRLFSLQGQVLYETKMNGPEVSLRMPNHVGNQKVVLLIAQDGTPLYRSVMGGVNR